MLTSDYGGAARPRTYDSYVRSLDGWAALYVEGWWSLEQFERHADVMREAMFARSPQP